ncbi:hypothetical protein CCR95_24160 [Thiocystis minor]|uniref:DUF2304 domain-containing protein n=1 Tax=Thiocystis minor TaxID=61597 RepID=UPI001911E57F|nr:DUF2304 domain-containing protein [Thiocystis minor]MBK5967077.1 hypothetical protein [Thiocystis minor]
MTYQMTSMAIGIGLAVVILWLVRRDHLHGPYAVWWIGAAATVCLLGFFPNLFDVIARSLGVGYPPVLALVLGFAMLLIKILTMDVERSRQERQIRRLAQQLAMLEARQPLPDQAAGAKAGTGDARRTEPDE